MTTEHDTEEETPPTGEWVYIGTRKVHESGRVYLPADNYGLGEDDAVDVMVDTGDDETDNVFVPDARIDSKARVTIPSRQRKLYGIESGDIVTVQFRPTGKTFNGDGS